MVRETLRPFGAARAGCPRSQERRPTTRNLPFLPKRAETMALPGKPRLRKAFAPAGSAAILAARGTGFSSRRVSRLERRHLSGDGSEETPPSLRAGRGQDAHAPRKSGAAGGAGFPDRAAPFGRGLYRKRRSAWPRGFWPCWERGHPWRRAGRGFRPAGSPSSVTVASAAMAWGNPSVPSGRARARMPTLPGRATTTTMRETPPSLRGWRGQDAHAPRKGNDDNGAGNPSVPSGRVRARMPTLPGKATATTVRETLRPSGGGAGIRDRNERRRRR